MKNRHFAPPKSGNNMAIAVSNVIILLDHYDATNDDLVLPIAAWVCKKGIQDIMLTGNINPMCSFYVVVDRRIQKMTVHEAYTMSVGRLSMIAGELGGQDGEDIIGIINGEEAFIKVDSVLSEDDKRKFLKKNLFLDN